jgi:tyrosyl-tRNA synthetase
LTARVTLAQILERDDFSKRLQAGEPISLHELLYPVAQAYDSVFLKADVELGGTDQLFNLLVGRDLMGKLGLQPQIVMTLPLLEGLDGVEKMSKSLGNYVAVEDPPEEMFGKLMSISDSLMWKYWTLLTDLDPSSVRTLQKSVSNGERHPMDVKIDLARAITGDFWGEEAARAAEEHFRAVHQKREIPEQIRKIDIVVNESTTVLVKLLPLGALAESNAAARRLIEQGAVKIDGQVIREPLAVVPTAPGTSRLIQVGKRHFVRLSFVSG